MPPDVANAVAGSAFDSASGITHPGPLGRGVIVQPDLPVLPCGAVALLEFRIVLAAETRPVRIIRRFPPDFIWEDEIGVFECGPEDRCAAFPEITFQGLDWRYQLTAVYAGFCQVCLRVRAIVPPSCPT